MEEFQWEKKSVEEMLGPYRFPKSGRGGIGKQKR